MLWLLSRLPFDIQLSLGRQIGKIIWHAAPDRRRVTLINLSIAFPEMSDTELNKLARTVYSHVGMSVSEMATLWFRPASFILPRFTLEGIEHLEKALSQGRGIILLQAHFTLIDFNAPIFREHFPFSVVFDPPKNKLFAAFLENRRNVYVEAAIENRQTRIMIRRLRQGGIVWYSPDQSVGRRHGAIDTQFFGHPVLTTVGTRRIASMTNAIVVPLIPTRHGNTGRYTLRIGQPIDIDSEDDLKATQQVNDIFEAQIREQPEQYFWMHKRFKPPGPQYKNPYTKP